MLNLHRRPSYKMGVPDPGSRDRDVVLVSAGLLGKPERGVGNLEYGGDGEGMRKGRTVTSNLGPRWTGSYHTKGGFPSKGNKGKLAGNGKGSKKTRDCAITCVTYCICVLYISNNCLNV